MGDELTEFCRVDEEALAVGVLHFPWQRRIGSRSVLLAGGIERRPLPRWWPVPVLAMGLAGIPWPIHMIGLVVVGAAILSPPVARLLLIGLVSVAPTFNPAVHSVGRAQATVVNPNFGAIPGSGRVYLVHVLVVVLFAASVAHGLKQRRRPRALAVVGLAAAYLVLQVVGRTDPAIAWVYRPLQPFLIAFAAAELFATEKAADRLGRAMAIGAAVGTGLVMVAVISGFDPFAATRPRDIPFKALVAGVERATGAFTYPNNLGTFSAYAALFGLSALTVGVPRLPRRLALVLVLASSSALILSTTRAAALGLCAGAAYLAVKTSTARRVKLVAAGMVALMIVVTLVSTINAFTAVANDRLATATRESLALRETGWAFALDQIAESPLVGVGAVESHLDSALLLYVWQGGVVGMLLLVLLARLCWFRGQGSPLRVALFIAFAVSGVLQDSLGQTLSTWFLGAALGLDAARSADREPQPTMAKSWAGCVA